MDVRPHAHVPVRFDAAEAPALLSASADERVVALRQQPPGSGYISRRSLVTNRPSARSEDVRCCCSLDPWSRMRF